MADQLEVIIRQADSLTKATALTGEESSSVSVDSTQRTLLDNTLVNLGAGYAADDEQILSDINAAIASADASWDATGKDAVKRLVTLILADADISTVVSAIAALE
jgi:hypothetical protein